MISGDKEIVQPVEKSNIRILFVNLWQSPGHAHYTVPLLRSLCLKPGIRIGLMHNKNQDVSCYQENIDFFPIHAPTGLRISQWDRLILQPLEFLKCLRAINKFNPDIIHFVFCYPWFTLYMPILAKKINVACTLHDVTPHHGEEYIRNRMAIKAMIRYCNPIFVHGNQCLNIAYQLYPSYKDKFIKIPLGHCDIVDPKNAVNKLSKNPVFLFFGRILPYKGLSFALKALEEILVEYPETKIIIAGEGSLKSEHAHIHRLSNNLEVINRRITETEISEFMGRSLAVLAPYTHASGSAVVATSYAYARPVIASNIGGIKDMVIHDKTGWFVETGNVKGIALAMKRAIENPDHMIQMGAYAKEYAKKEWSWDNIAQTHIEAYKRVLFK